MARRLSDIERELRKERSQAARWAKKHGVGSLPGKRLETGETAKRERSSFFSGRDHARRDGRSVVSLDQHETLDQWEQAQLSNGANYLPLVGRSDTLGPRELATRAKVQHVLTFMLPMHVDLLLMRHVEKMTLDDLAEEFAVSYQAVQQRLRVAEQDFLRLWTEHKDDPLDWREAL